MRAMVLRQPGEPLEMEERPDPSPGPGQVRVRIEACGVCRTDLHVIDGELPDPKLPIVPGHEIVGRVDALGAGVTLELGARVGVAWLGSRLRPLPLLPDGAREPVRHAAVHRLYARRRLRHAYDRRRGVRLPAWRRPRSGRDGAAALRGADRLALAQDGGRRRRRSASTVSARRPTSSRRSAAGRGGASSPSPRPATRRARPSPARWARNGRAGRTKGRPSRSTRPSSSLPSARWFPRRSRRCARAAGWCAAAST